MDIRALAKTKTFWTGLAAVITGVGMIVSGNESEGAQTVILGLLAVFGRDAIAKGK